MSARIGANMKQGVLRIGSFLDHRPDRAPHAPGRRSEPGPRWSLDVLAGRVGELSGLAAAARLSFAFSLVVEAQRRGDTAAWVTDRRSTFFPPDAAANGVATEALPVVFVPDAAAAARAADKLVRSGGFGLVVLDLVVPPRAGSGLRPAPARAPSRAPSPHSAGAPSAPRAGREIPPALLSRLGALAQQHEAAVLFLTRKSGDEPSLGPLVSLRCETTRLPVPGSSPAATPAATHVAAHAAADTQPGRFLCQARALKDKRGAPGWTFTEVRCGPLGLR